MSLSSEQQYYHRTELRLIQEQVHHSTLGFPVPPRQTLSDKAQTCRLEEAAKVSWACMETWAKRSFSEAKAEGPCL